MLAAPTDQARAQSHAAAMASITGMPVRAGAVLALASTFAGNLLIVGSIANIIVVEQPAGRSLSPSASPRPRDVIRLWRSW